MFLTKKMRHLLLTFLPSSLAMAFTFFSAKKVNKKLPAAPIANKVGALTSSSLAQ